MCFQQSLAFGRLARAWDLAVLLKERDIFLALGEAALKVLDIQLATRVYRELGDAGMVMSLIKLEGLEDAHLLSGHLALIFDDHSAAQDHFLQSTRPLAALEMRRDLLHWEQALKLAKTLATEQVPLISRSLQSSSSLESSMIRRCRCTRRAWAISRSLPASAVEGRPEAR